jgi:ferredoxin
VILAVFSNKFNYSFGKATKMIVTIEDTCTACGLCADTCPEVFELGDDIAEVLMDTVPIEYEEDVEQAAEECPVEAIIIHE